MGIIGKERQVFIKPVFEVENLAERREVYL